MAHVETITQNILYYSVKICLNIKFTGPLHIPFSFLFKLSFHFNIILQYATSDVDRGSQIKTKKGNTFRCVML